MTNKFAIVGRPEGSTLVKGNKSVSRTKNKEKEFSAFLRWSLSERRNGWNFHIYRLFHSASNGALEKCQRDSCVILDWRYHNRKLQGKWKIRKNSFTAVAFMTDEHLPLSIWIKFAIESTQRIAARTWSETCWTCYRKKRICSVSPFNYSFTMAQMIIGRCKLHPQRRVSLVNMTRTTL